MPFFAELVDEPPESLPRQVHYDHPHDRPQHWVPGEAGFGVVVARTEQTVVHVAFHEVYPRGVSLAVLAMAHPDGPEIDHMAVHDNRRAGGMRLGLELTDGRRGEAHDSWHPGRVTTPAPEPDFHFMPRGSGGGGLSFAWDLWLCPLPPAGPATLYFRWDDRGIPETGTSIDLTPLAAAAADAYELWPLPSYADAPRPEGGWFAYSPLSGPTAAFTAVDDGSGDALDGQDEDR